MTQNKKSNLPIKGKKKNKSGLFLVILSVIILSIIGLELYKAKNNLLVGETKYYTGTIYSANQAANMLDYLDDGNNIILSPINVNTSLAILYNGTDNNSNKELKRYFNKTQNEVNEEMIHKLSYLNAENEQEFNEYVQNSKDASLYDIEATAQYGDQLLTLSTCEFSQEDGRLAVVARKITN